MANFFSVRAILIHTSEVLKYEVTIRQCVPSGNFIIGSAVLTLHVPLLPTIYDSHKCNALNALTKCYQSKWNRLYLLPLWHTKHSESRTLDLKIFHLQIKNIN